MRKIVAVMADGHAGSKVGLCHPRATVTETNEKGETYQRRLVLTETQRDLLWPIYESAIKEVVELADGDPIIVIYDGDATNGEKYPDGMMDIDRGQQVEVACWNMVPWLKLPNLECLAFAGGTAAHSLMGRNISEALIARKLSKVAQTVAFSHARVRVLDKVLDVAHHGPSGGSRAWLRGNVARYYLRDRMMEDMGLGKEPADVYLRGHFHVDVHEVLKQRFHQQVYRSELIVIPSMSGLSGFAGQITRSIPYVDNGMYALEIIEGEPIRVHAFVWRKDIREEIDL